MTEENSMPSYTFDQFGWFEKEVELATLRSVEVAPPFIPDYPREVGKAWLMLNPLMDSWRIVAFEEPPTPLEVKATTISKAEFMRLFGIEKFIEIIQATKTNIEVESAYRFSELCEQIDLNHPDTATYLGILAKNGLLTQPQIEMISNNQAIW
jgi:hypothetical protein